MEKVIGAKGKHAFKASKVKGHITDKQVKDGEHRAEDKAGNDEADRLADLGVREMGDGPMQLGTFYSLRQRDLGRLVHQTQKYIVDIVREASNIRRPPTPSTNTGNNNPNHTCFKPRHPKTLVQKKLKYPEAAEGFKVELGKEMDKAQKGKTGKAKEEGRFEEAIHIFIERTKWAMPDEEADPEAGVTWLELFVRYTQEGGYIQQDLLESEYFETRITTREAYDSFRRCSRRVVETHAKDGDHIFFQPARIAGAGLRLV